MKRIGEVILITAAENVAHRGHRKDDNVSNPENVKNIFRFAAKHYTVIADRVKI